jgi:hypothetical protein
MNGSARVLLLALGAALAASAVGCGTQPPRTSVRVDFWDATGTFAPVRPTAISLSWLDDYGFYFQDRTFAVPSGAGDYLGNVLVSAYDADAGPRRAFAFGLVGGSSTPVSIGWAVGEQSADEPELPMTIMLNALPASGVDPYDGDGDGVPDQVDNCPGLNNPDQSNKDC